MTPTSQRSFTGCCAESKNHFHTDELHWGKISGQVQILGPLLLWLQAKGIHYSHLESLQSFIGKKVKNYMNSWHFINECLYLMIETAQCLKKVPMLCWAISYYPALHLLMLPDFHNGPMAPQYWLQLPANPQIPAVPKLNFRLLSQFSEIMHTEPKKRARSEEDGQRETN